MSKISQKLIQTQKISPQQMLNISIIQLNANLMEKNILDELENNPALELIENSEKVDSNEDEDENNFEWDELVSNPEEYEYKPSGHSRHESRPLENIASINNSLVDDILNQLNDLNASKQDLELAEYIIGNLSDDGYLEIDTMLLADKFNVLENDVNLLLTKIRTLDPPGIGSRDLQECLLAQLEYFYPDGILAKEIIKNHFLKFKEHKYSEIINKTCCNKKDFENVLSTISILTPRPAVNYSNISNYNLLPDILLEKHNDDWIIFANDQHLPALSINNKYKEILLSNVDNDAKNFLKQKIQKAKWFIDAINSRFFTIIKIMKSIIKHQQSYFNFDDRVLTPMKLKTIADDINMDISTISRATNGKYVQLPWGIRELKSFFSDGVKTKSGNYVSNTIVKKIIKEIINKENLASPYTDQEITDILNKRGYILARRTIAKYRESLKISVARLRKKNI